MRAFTSGKCVLVLAMLAAFSFFAPAVSFSQEKIGVLFIDAGESGGGGLIPDGYYDLRWRIQFSDHLFQVWPAGFLAGRNGWEGDTCYSHIHFADAIEAEICTGVTGGPVLEGDAIDAFCQVHPEYNGYDTGGDPIVHGMFRHSGLFGDDTFTPDCYDDGSGSDPTVLFPLLGSETVNPYRDETFLPTIPDLDNLGPHVDDPTGPGIGIADFTESSAFNWMKTHYYTFGVLGQKSPYMDQVKEWYYGGLGSTNIQTALGAAVLADPGIPAGTQLVYRHGSESFSTNTDEYGNPKFYPESMETAIDELINDEAVDRIVAFSLSSDYINLTQYAEAWCDENGYGVSKVPGRTYRQCVEDLSDGVGPATVADRDRLIADKPWDMYKAVFKDAAVLVNGRVPISFTKAYGTSSAYDQTLLEMLKYTVAKYGIPNDGTSLKVILTSHGASETDSYMNGNACDIYFKVSAEVAARIAATITSSFPWAGKFKVVHAGVEQAQPGEGGNYDAPTPVPYKPFGDVLSAGEEIDRAIKGRYVNELGEVIDNGIVDDATNEVFDYVILLPTTFDAESSDTLQHMRNDTLGNMELGLVGTTQAWIRQEEDQSGREYGDPIDPPFYDSDFFTLRVMDASGWCTEAADTTVVCRGSAADPTTVIISGTVLSYPDNIVRTNITNAAVEVITDAIKNPLVGGFHSFEPDGACPNSPYVIITLKSFEATPGSQSVKLSWATASEIDNAGFNLYRSELEGGGYQKVNSSLISAEGSAVQGASYKFVDTGLKNRKTYYYKLEDVDANGTVTLHGPVSAVPKLIYAIR